MIDVRISVFDNDYRCLAYTERKLFESLDAAKAYCDVHTWSGETYRISHHTPFVPRIAKRYRYTKQPLSPAYEITHFSEDGETAFAQAITANEINAVFRKDLWPDLIPALA